MERLKYKRFVLVKDNFYDDPGKVYQTAKSADFYEPEDSTGYRSREVYHEKGIKKKLENILGIKINRWDEDPYDENGIFYFGLSRGNRKEIPGVHSDEPYNDITVVVYVTPGIPINCGTSLWMHRQTGLCDPAMPADAKRFGKKLSSLQNQFEKESKLRDRWQEIDRIGYRFNRMVAYPSGIFHSATNHYGGSMNNARIYQTFRIGVDWGTFRMGKV